MKIKSAIFDFDGTVFDSMDIWRDLGMKYLRHLGYEANMDIADLFFCMSTRRAILEAKQIFNIKMTEKELTDGLNDFLKQRYLTEAKPKNDIIEFLEKLKKAGVRICIATASDREPVTAALAKFGMLPYFEKIFTVSEIGKGKGSPEIFRAAAYFLETEKSETYVFEDALYAAQTAKADGFKLIGIYDKSEPCKEELRSISDYYIYNYSELDIT